jgi:hypothetical protein
MTAARRSGAVPPADGASIDALYGLEPVFEPGAAAADGELGGFAVVDCPYCGEAYETHLDLTVGACSYVEDCQACCQPIELELRLGDDGAFESLGARRLD